MKKIQLAILIIGLSAHHLSLAATNNQVTRQGFRASICNIAELTVDYTFAEAYGEPLITSKMKWQAGANTSADCLTGLTFIYLKFRKKDGSSGYIKLSPKIVASGQAFGPTATESPAWKSLICNSTTKNASCLAEADSRSIYLQGPRIDSFEVVAEASIAQQSTTSSSKTKSAKSSGDDSGGGFSFDSLLEQAIDNTIQPAQQTVTEVEIEPEAVEEKISPQEIARQMALQEQEHAEQAKNNVVILINTTLAQYSTPAGSCESGRSVAHSVSVSGTCQMSFRSESKHQYLCSDDGRPKDIRSSRNADLNFASDIDQIAPLRISESGWVALILELKEKLGLSDSGDFKVNRWQFTTAASQIDEMEMLASNLATLKSYCEKNS